MPPSTRDCGECTACCFSLGITEVFSPPFTWCNHCQIGTGCRIYQQRPLSCRLFECEWRKGFGRQRDRPDKVGYVLDVVQHDVVGHGVLQIHVYTENALESSKAKREIREGVRKNGVVLCVKRDGSQKAYIGKRHLDLMQSLQLSNWEVNAL